MDNNSYPDETDDPTPDELLRQMMMYGAPMAPNRPRGFDPAVRREAIREAPIIFAQLRNGAQVLLYAVVEGREVDFHEVFFGELPETPVLHVRCEDDEDVDFLREFIEQVKLGGSAEDT
jgi:hypothetical protein